MQIFRQPFFALKEKTSQQDQSTITAKLNTLKHDSVNLSSNTSFKGGVHDNLISQIIIYDRRKIRQLAELGKELLDSNPKMKNIAALKNLVPPEATAPYILAVKSFAKKVIGALPKEARGEQVSQLPSGTFSKLRKIFEENKSVQGIKDALAEAFPGIGKI